MVYLFKELVIRTVTGSEHVYLSQGVIEAIFECFIHSGHKEMDLKHGVPNMGITRSTE